MIGVKDCVVISIDDLFPRTVVELFIRADRLKDFKVFRIAFGISRAVVAELVHKDHRSFARL